LELWEIQDQLETLDQSDSQVLMDQGVLQVLKDHREPQVLTEILAQMVCQVALVA